MRLEITCRKCGRTLRNTMNNFLTDKEFDAFLNEFNWTYSAGSYLCEACK